MNGRPDPDLGQCLHLHWDSIPPRAQHSHLASPCPGPSFPSSPPGGGASSWATRSSGFHAQGVSATQPGLVPLPHRCACHPLPAYQLVVKISPMGGLHTQRPPRPPRRFIMPRRTCVRAYSCSHEPVVNLPTERHSATDPPGRELRADSASRPGGPPSPIPARHLPHRTILGWFGSFAVLPFLS